MEVIETFVSNFPSEKKVSSKPILKMRLMSASNFVFKENKQAFFFAKSEEKPVLKIYLI